MIELAMSVCLISEPTRCKDVSLTFNEESISVQQCAMSSIGTVAEWSAQHPQWAVARWQCREAGTVANL